MLRTSWLRAASPRPRLPRGRAAAPAKRLLRLERLEERDLPAAPVFTIDTVAGAGTAGFNGDGQPAVNAQLDQPSAVVFDNQGDILFIDDLNQRVREVTPDGTISTFAGSGVRAGFRSNFTGDGGPATSASFNFDDGGGLAV